MQLYLLDLGLTPYDVAWSLQKRAALARSAGTLDQDLLILVQHPPVVTLGRGTKPGNLLVTPEYLTSRGVELRDVERGGDVTIHEPGQLVAYPIVDLKRHKQDLHWYLRQVEESVIVALRTFDLETGRVVGLTGVWREDAAGKRKLASIGVHARDWVTWHGVALNVANDLSTFDHVVPCGIDQVTMSTVRRECAAASLREPSFSEVSAAVADGLASVFGLVAKRISLEDIDTLL
ncbi:lipoyl(octanoyl) transferase LipB [Gemmatimonas sp.]|uniref:lipoyl(octanoyl) transferase LipB n=1 Tax=Gemmatimonas sp. TaxID=1962908 RepID=UPI00398343C5